MTSRGDERRAGSLSAGIYLVATPIGNLEDITLRALRVLREADLIACEDTRQTQKLLHHFEIKRPTVSYHEHNESARAEELIARAQAGEAIAVVSDAGMPGISDPGFRVVQKALEAGVPVTPIPGAVALASALVASGLPTDDFRFAGFLPAKGGERRTRLEGLRAAGETLVFYEAPHRLLETLADVAAVLGPQRRVVVARELTKLHEEFIRGTAEEVLVQLREREVRGEITLLIAGAGASDDAAVRPQGTVAARVRELIAAGNEEKEALKLAAREFQMGKSEAYREWQRTKASGKHSRKS